LLCVFKRKNPVRPKIKPFYLGAEINTKHRLPHFKMSLVKTYLVLYNFAQTIGWSFILYKLVHHYLTNQPQDKLWQEVGPAVTLFQSAAILEIIHSITGLVRTPAATTFIQVFSRVALVVICAFVPDAQRHWIVSLMLFSWSITEVIRYSFYALSQLDSVPYPLGWLRYTLFIILYPSGVAGEIGTILASLDHVKKTDLFSILMPNAHNFAFSFYYALLAALPVYAVGLPYLYSYMLGQRKRFIYGDKKKTT